MSKLNLELKVPSGYEKAAVSEIIRAICGQVNSLSEGRIAARYAAFSIAPTGSATPYDESDIVWDMNVTVKSSVVPGLPIDYVRLGWVNNVAGSPGTFQEIRVPVGTHSSVPSNVVLAANGSGGFGFRTLTSSDVPASGLTMGSPVASTSGASIDFTGIGSSAKKVFVGLSGVSTNGTSVIILQLGTSSGVEATGYGGGAGSGATFANYTTGFGISDAQIAAAVFHGGFTLHLIDSSTNTWACTNSNSRSDSANVSVGSGSKSLAAVLDRVRLTTVGGVNTFDAGKVNVVWE